MKRTWAFSLTSLTLIAVVLWLSVLTRPTPNLKIIACDVGQGDAILVTKGDMQILIDGGPNNSVISCLSRHMPFWDRQIEGVVLTHPDADHYAGLIEVVRRYKVDRFVSTEVGKDNVGFNTLKDLVVSLAIPTIFPKVGAVVSNGLLSIEILSPKAEMFAERSQVLGSYTPEKVNDYSIVMHLAYGEFDAILTGDIETEISDTVAQEVAKIDGGIEYLKVPHHGSINGLSQILLNTVDPEIAVISVGAKNRYGHPRAEIIKMLEVKDLEILRTDELGDVVVETDGKSWEIINN